MKTRVTFFIYAALMAVFVLALFGFPLALHGAEPAPIAVQARGDGSFVMLTGQKPPLLVVGAAPTGNGILRIAANGTLDIQAGAIVNFPTGFIPWASVNKAGSSLADLATRSASDLSSGVLASARGGAGTVNGILQANGSGLTSAVTVGSSLNYGTGTLDTIQDIRATASPTFVSATLSALATASTTVALATPTGLLSTDGDMQYDPTTNTLGVGVSGSSSNGVIQVGGSAGTGTITGHGSTLNVQGQPLNLAATSTGLLTVTTNSVERLRIGSAGAWGLSGSNFGTAGQVLTSAGSAAPPTWGFVAASTITGILGAANGGTGNGFTAFTGPTTTTKTFTLPNANATIARTDAAQTFTGTQTFNGAITMSSTFGITSAGTIQAATLKSNFNIQLLDQTLQTNYLGLQSVDQTGLGSNVTLSLNTNGASRTLGILSDVALNQNLLTTSSPTFAALTLTAPLTGANGGTGVANTGKTITLGGNLTTAGAFASTFTMTNTTSVTFPATGTLATTAGTVASITGTAGQVLANGVTTAQTGAVTLSLPTALTGINSVTSGAGSNLILGTGTFGSSLTFTSATGVATFGPATVHQSDVSFNSAIAAANTVSSGAISLRLGVLASTPGTSTDAWIGVNNSGGPGLTAGDLLYISRSNVSAGHRWYTGNGAITVRMVLNTAGDLSLTNATASTSTSTGSFVTGGGVGAAGAGYFGGTINYVGATVSGGVNVDANAAKTRWVRYSTAGVLRWGVSANSTAESTGNAGSDFAITAYDDSGGSLGDALLITRSNKLAAFGGAVTIASSTSSTSTTTGSGVFAGGIGVAGAAFFGQNVETASFFRSTTPNGTESAYLLTQSGQRSWKLFVPASLTSFVIRDASGSFDAATFSTTAAGSLALGYTTEATAAGAGSLTTAGGVFATKRFVTSLSFVGGVQTFSGAGAASSSVAISAITSSGVAQAITLADGVAGQEKVIIHEVDGGSLLITPTTKTGYSGVTLTNAGDSVTFVFLTTRGWCITGNNGATIIP